MKRGIPFVIIVGVLGASALSAWYLKRSTAETPRLAVPATSGPATGTGPIKVGAEPAHTLGDPNAPVMLEEFGDFQCPSCASLHAALKSLKAEFGPRLVIVFREFPLLTAHRHAHSAARAAEAAGLQGKFWQMHDLLYENQKTWHEASNVQPIFEEYATRIDLDLNLFKRDVSSSMAQRRIELDQERGRWIGVTGTPTLFLNGREVALESLSTDKLRALINSELKSGKQ